MRRSNIHNRKERKKEKQSSTKEHLLKVLEEAVTTDGLLFRKITRGHI